MLVRLRRLPAALPAAAKAYAPRALCSAATSGLHAALERHRLPPDVVPAGTDTQTALRQLRLLEALGVPDVERAVRRDPTVLTHDTKSIAGRHLEYLLSLGVTKIGPMIEATPQMLSCDLNRDLYRKVAILQALGVKKIASWMQKNKGRICVMDVDTDMRPPIEFLQSVPGLHVHKVLETLPRGIFGAKNAERLEARVAELAELTGVDADDEAFGRMVSRWPQMLTAHLEDTVKPKVRRRRHRTPPPPPPAPPPSLCWARGCNDELKETLVRTLTISHQQDIHRPSSPPTGPWRHRASPQTYARTLALF